MCRTGFWHDEQRLRDDDRRRPGSGRISFFKGRDEHIPVHFSHAQNDSDDAFALARLLDAVKRCGFDEIVLEYEPVAAAYSYERTLQKDELILIGDFGGGTSDFSILHVGPSVKRRGRTKENIVGYDGVAIAGDAFDRQIIRKL